MTYNITRKYETDFSETDVPTTLTNVARAMADAKGVGIPTRNAFKNAQLIDEDRQEFEVELLPTVADAGIDVNDLLPSECVYDEGRYYLKIRGIDRRGDTPRVRVIVRKAQNGDACYNGRGPMTLEDKAQMWRRAQ